ncbi:MAG: hypothetical protein ABL984_00785 [Pyrinomonadaceae bacterium]
MHLPPIHGSFVSILLLLACNALAFGQYQERVLERARSVKMLTDDREAVRKVFHDFTLDSSDETSDEFSFGETQVKITYSGGGCSEDDDDQIWDVAAGQAVGIRIEEETKVKPSDVRINLAPLLKEQIFDNDDDQFIFHSKTEGIAVRVDGDAVEFPTYFRLYDRKQSIARTIWRKSLSTKRAGLGSRSSKSET